MMKRFDNTKELKDYLENEAKIGETVILDERATESHPKRSHFFTKSKSHYPERTKQNAVKNTSKKQ